MHKIDMLMDYYVWGTMLECYQRYLLKLTNTVELKGCSVYDMKRFATRVCWY